MLRTPHGEPGEIWCQKYPGSSVDSQLRSREPACNVSLDIFQESLFRKVSIPFVPQRLNLIRPLCARCPPPVAIPLSPRSQPARLHRCCCLLLLLHAAPGFRALPRSTGAIASNARHLTLLLDPTTRLVSSCPLFPPSPLLLTLHTASATSTLHHPPSSPHPRCDSTSPCTFAVRSRRACNNNNTCSPTTASLRRNIPVQLPPAALSRRMRQPLARLAAQHSPHRR